LELKSLPSYLRYEFLCPNYTFPIIFSAKLNGAQIEKLSCVLQKYKGIIGYNIDDIKGISPSFCMHQILLKDEHRPFRQPQHRLNPNMQEVIQKEVLSYLMSKSSIQSQIVIGLAWFK